MSEELYDEWIPGERLRAYDTPRARAERERRKTATMGKLYRMTQTNKKTGKSRVIYGHATSNVMDQFWQAYVDEKHSVTIEEWSGDE